MTPQRHLARAQSAVPKPFKWAYDYATQELDVWPVDGPEPWDRPQHGEHLTDEEYATLYQGRIVLSGSTVVSFTQYPDRPFQDNTPDGHAAAKAAIDAWVAKQ